MMLLPDDNPEGKPEERIFSLDQAREWSKLPGLSDAQRDGLRVQMTSARSREDAAAVYGTIHQYAPPNDGSTSLRQMEIFARTCALVAKTAGLEVAGSPDASAASDASDASAEAGALSKGEIERLEAELRHHQQAYLEEVGRATRDA